MAPFNKLVQIIEKQCGNTNKPKTIAQNYGSMLEEGLDQLPQPEQSLCICEMERGLGKMCADFVE